MPTISKARTSEGNIEVNTPITAVTYFGIETIRFKIETIPLYIAENKLYNMFST